MNVNYVKCGNSVLHTTSVMGKCVPERLLNRFNGWILWDFQRMFTIIQDSLSSSFDHGRDLSFYCNIIWPNLKDVMTMHEGSKRQHHGQHILHPILDWVSQQRCHP